MAQLPLAPTDIPPPGQRTLLRRAGREIALFNVDGQLYAIDDSCPHAGSALCTGKLDGLLIQCPSHGLRFDLRTGAMPGNLGLRVHTYPVQREGEGCVLVLPDEED